MREVLRIGDLIGTTYNRLTILEEGLRHIEPNGKAQRVMVCECSCGTIKNVSLKELRRGTTKSCGCIAEEQKVDIKKENAYGYLTILSEASPHISTDGSKIRKVSVRCICGTEKEIILNSLRQGITISCGCMTEHKTGYQTVSIDSPIPEMTLESMNQRKLHHWKIIEVISAKRNENREIIRTVKAQCKCGYVKEAVLDDVGDSKQCSTCAIEEIKSKISYEDRKLRARLEGVYKGMKTRCYKENNKDFANYGGRGIKIEDSFNTFVKFYEWAVSKGYTYDCKLEIDREDNDGNYSIKNCRLVSRTENNRNMRRNVMSWEIVNDIRNGKYIGLPYTELAKLLGCSVATIADVRKFKTWKPNT